MKVLDKKARSRLMVCLKKPIYSWYTLIHAHLTCKRMIKNIFFLNRERYWSILGYLTSLLPSFIWFKNFGNFFLYIISMKGKAKEENGLRMNGKFIVQFTKIIIKKMFAKNFTSVITWNLVCVYMNDIILIGGKTLILCS